MIKLTKVSEDDTSINYSVKEIKKQSDKELSKLAKELERNMAAAAKELDFERAAEYRDRLIIVKGELGQKLLPKSNRRK